MQLTCRLLHGLSTLSSKKGPKSMPGVCCFCCLCYSMPHYVTSAFICAERDVVWSLLTKRYNCCASRVPWVQPSLDSSPLTTSAQCGNAGSKNSKSEHCNSDGAVVESQSGRAGDRSRWTTKDLQGPSICGSQPSRPSCSPDADEKGQCQIDRLVWFGQMQMTLGLRA